MSDYEEVAGADLDPADEFLNSVRRFAPDRVGDTECLPSGEIPELVLVAERVAPKLGDSRIPLLCAMARSIVTRASEAEAARNCAGESIEENVFSFHEGARSALRNILREEILPILADLLPVDEVPVDWRDNMS